jgi:hypothetical protein
MRPQPELTLWQLEVLRVVAIWYSMAPRRHITTAAVRSGKAVRLHVGVVPVILQRSVSLIDGP